MKIFLKSILWLAVTYQVAVQCAPLEPFGEAVGDRMVQKADDAFAQVAVTHPFVFLEHTYNELFLGTNGFISFNQGYTSFVPSSFPVQGVSLLCAFWSDIDPRHDCSSLAGGNLNNNIFYRQITDQGSPVLQGVSNQIRAYDARYRTFRAQWVLVLTYSKVVRYGTSCGVSNPINTFQIVLATDGRYSFSIFNYDTLEWIVHGANHAIAGFNRFDGKYYREIEGSGTADLRKVLTDSNTGVPGRWIFRLDADEIEGLDCSNLTNSQISVSPKFGPVMGGNEVIVGGICFDESTPVDQIICQFGNSSLPGRQQSSTSVRCVPPTPGYVGTVQLSVSVDNGTSFPYVSTYTFDQSTHSVRLLDQHLWELQTGAVNMQLQWNPYEIDADLDTGQNDSKVAIDLVGWYISGSDVTKDVRTIFIPLVPSAINSGRMDINILSKIPLQRPDFPNEKLLFLRGALRVTKDTMKNATSVGSASYNQSVLPVSLWSPLFDLDLLERLAAPSSRDAVPDSYEHIGRILTYVVRRTLQPLFSEEAVAAIPFYKGLPSLFDAVQWVKYLNGHTERQQLMTRVLGCTSEENFCACWAAAEREILRYNSDDCEDFPGCPPNANQARLDRARFSVESPLTSTGSCNRFFTTDSTFWPIGPCAENPGSILCVVAPTVSRKYQQQCCYGDNANLILADSSAGGGRVTLLVGDRQAGDLDSGLVWIAKKLEEAITDRIPLRKCCGTVKWNTEGCRRFRSVRKGGSSRCYVPPRPAVGFGDPHIQTYDGFRYTSNGLGEYVLLEIPNVIMVQGRTAQAKSAQGTDLRARVWSGIALRVGNTTVQISISSRGEGLNLYLNREGVDLDEVSTLIVFDDSIIHLERQNNSALKKVSSQLALGILVEIEEVDSVLQFQVSLPSNYKNSQSSGLLGRWNDDPSDDLWPRNQTAPLSQNSTTETIFTLFGETWRVEREESLFEYQPPETYENINNLGFRPLFEAPEIQNETLKREAEEVCGDNAECMFDIAATGLLRMGQVTKNFVTVIEEEFNTSTNIVVSCGYPTVDESVVIASNSTYTSGESVQLACRNESISKISGSETLTCSAEGIWSGEAMKCDGIRLSTVSFACLLAAFLALLC